MNNKRNIDSDIESMANYLHGKVQKDIEEYARSMGQTPKEKLEVKKGVYMDLIRIFQEKYLDACKALDIHFPENK